ncbi:hypothetical protein, partial [Streptomyces cadmiisoli]|uniref:hypothetical protein n=1 Tax=Streptomyces cadmiisoli TaxID=2184053 RepID=UPI003D7547C7
MPQSLNPGNALDVQSAHRIRMKVPQSVANSIFDTSVHMGLIRLRSGALTKFHFATAFAAGL